MNISTYFDGRPIGQAWLHSASTSLAMWASWARAQIDPALAVLGQWRARSRSRRELGQLDAHLLHDIGVEHSQAAFESGKRFWQV